jgi:hypothetical protein
MPGEGEAAEGEEPLVEIPEAQVPAGDDISSIELAAARAAFDSRTLDAARVRELRLTPTTVCAIESDKIRPALAELGVTVGGAELFNIVALADPGAVGVLTRKTWMDVVRWRKRLAAEAEREAGTLCAYVALGGTNAKAEHVRLAPLLGVMEAFGCGADVAKAKEAIVSRRLRAMEEVLALGGELEDDELDELKATERIDFEDLRAFAEALTGPRPR